MERTQQAGTKRLPKPNSVVTVPCTDSSFYKWWCVFLRPFIYLTDKEIDVVACFLQLRQELSQKIPDAQMVDTLLMNNATKEKVRELCNITLAHFYVIMGSLRKKKVLVNNSINPKLIPSMTSNTDSVFQLVILFKKTPDNDI